jgi:hypothetical protein
MKKMRTKIWKKINENSKWQNKKNKINAKDKRNSNQKNKSQIEYKK